MSWFRVGDQEFHWTDADDASLFVRVSPRLHLIAVHVLSEAEAIVQAAEYVASPWDPGFVRSGNDYLDYARVREERQRTRDSARHR